MVIRSFTENHKKYWVLGIVAIIQIMINLDFTAVNLALAPIAKDFYVSMMTVQWIINAYIIASGALMIVFGRLSELFGKKLFFILGVIVFTIASVLAGFSSNISFLISSRIIQGIGFAMLFPVSIAIVFDAFPKNQKGFAIGSVVAVGGMSQGLGPSIGGLIIQTLNWRWIFFINLPLGLLCSAVAFHILSLKKFPREKFSIDYAGSALLAGALIFIMLIFNDQFPPSICFFSFLLGLLFFWIFIFVERKINNPIIDIMLLKNREFIIYNLTRALFGYGYLAILFIIGLYLQNIMGYKPAKAGLIILFMSITFGLFTPLIGKWADISGMRINLSIGLIGGAIAFILMTFIAVPKSWFAFIFPLIMLGISATFVIPVNAAASLKAVDSKKTSSASGIYYTNSMIGGAIGVAMTAFLINKISLHFLKTSLAAKNFVFSSKQFVFLKHVASGTNSINYMTHFFSPRLAEKLIPIAQTAFLHGFSAAMWVCAILCLIAFILLLCNWSML